METKVKGNKDKLIKYLANVYIESIKCENDFLNDLIKGDDIFKNKSIRSYIDI